MSNPLQIKNLTKSYEGHNALDRVSLECVPGSIVGLIGPNGSGKTTLLNSIAGLCAPSNGSVTTLGRSPLKLSEEGLSQLGVVQQEMDLLEWLTVIEHLEYVASYYSNWDFELQAKLLEEFGIKPTKGVGSLSTGDKQKLSIVLAVCHHPKLLILDEPASALDPNARSKLLKLLIDIAREDETAIIISSHILVDIEKVIDHVWFLKDGKLIVDKDIDILKESFAEWTVSPIQGQALPDHFPESFVLKQEGDDSLKSLLVSDPEIHRQSFFEKYQLKIKAKPLNLEAIYPLLA